ncbi:hypothetical protein ABW19_dt0208239 [Dactylella cylindrospora]|nr:hypothetical protein ABW19_dt0208239 [Dactylella cylindrospora]
MVCDISEPIPVPNGLPAQLTLRPPPRLWDRLIETHMFRCWCGSKPFNPNTVCDTDLSSQTVGYIVKKAVPSFQPFAVYRTTRPSKDGKLDIYVFKTPDHPEGIRPLLKLLIGRAATSGAIYDVFKHTLWQHHDQMAYGLLPRPLLDFKVGHWAMGHPDARTIIWTRDNLFCNLFVDAGFAGRWEAYRIARAIDVYLQRYSITLEECCAKDGNKIKLPTSILARIREANRPVTRPSSLMLS